MESTLISINHRECDKKSLIQLQQWNKHRNNCCERKNYMYRTLNPSRNIRNIIHVSTESKEPFIVNDYNRKQATKECKNYYLGKPNLNEGLSHPNIYIYNYQDWNSPV